MTTAITVRDINADDLTSWRDLYNGYGEFYKMPVSDDTATTVWSWLNDPDHPVCGLLAVEADGTAIGLAHYRDMPSPLRGVTVGFLDDLFVSPDRRGSGTADALLHRIGDIGKARGWPNFQWKTADNNYRGRGFYDRISNKTHWVLYQYDIS